MMLLMMLMMMMVQVKNCTVHINDDSVFEPEEEFQVHLGTPQGDHWSGAMVGVSDIVTVTITNDEDGKQRTGFPNLSASLFLVGFIHMNRVADWLLIVCIVCNVLYKVMTL